MPDVCSGGRSAMSFAVASRIRRFSRYVVKEDKSFGTKICKTDMAGSEI